MGRESLAGDLSEPVATTEKDRGLQMMVTLPSSIEKNLSPEASARLQQIGQTLLSGLLLEAQRLAARESKDLGLKIMDKHISQAEIMERKRHQTKQDRWDYLQNLGYAGVGAGIGSVSQPTLALTLVLAFGGLLLFAQGRD
jgi:hypothetical protein